MKKSKIFKILAATLALTFAFASCGSDDSDDTNVSNNGGGGNGNDNGNGNDSDNGQSGTLPNAVGEDPVAGKEVRGDTNPDDTFVRYAFGTDKTVTISTYIEDRWSGDDQLVSSCVADYSYDTEKKEIYTKIKKFIVDENTSYTVDKINEYAEYLAEEDIKFRTARGTEFQDETNKATYKEMLTKSNKATLTAQFNTIQILNYETDGDETTFQENMDNVFACFGSDESLTDFEFNYGEEYTAVTVSVDKEKSTFVASDIYYTGEEDDQIVCHKVDGTFEGSYDITNDETKHGIFTYTKKPSEVDSNN